MEAGHQPRGRLSYLSLGLSVVLGFIGVKLSLHAAHEYGLAVPDISTGVSLIGAD